MGGQTACEKCGLKAVRYELERRGIIMRFCDDCYWGELDAAGSPAGQGDTKTERVGPPVPERR